MQYYFVNLIVTCDTLKSCGILIGDLIEYCCHFVHVFVKFRTIVVLALICVFKPFNVTPYNNYITPTL